jgi:preprotein translocase SecE subunit
MAVAEKKSQESATTSAFDRVAVVSLIGVVYVLGSLAVVFKLVPDVWRLVWGRGLNLNPDSFTGTTLMVLVVVAAAVGLVILGRRLLGTRQVPGVRAGIFFGLIYFLLALLMTRWVSIWIEYWVYYDHWFGDSGRTVGIVLTALAGAGFFFLAIRWMMRAGFERTVLRFEGAGWFSAHALKPQQGQKVRRGTILGILIVLGSGIWTMYNHKILERGPESWSIGIPFTGTIKDIAPNDARKMLTEKFGDKCETEGAPAYEYRTIVDRFEGGKLVRIQPELSSVTVLDEDGKKYTFNRGDIVPKSEIADLKKRLVGSDQDKLPDAEEARKQSVSPVVVPAQAPTGKMELAAITLLPHLRFTLPFVLAATSIWFAWRVVNLPTFADFLIATEAELNKVSWTSRRRLYQDTVVVLMTMVLLAAVLFAMDQIWLHLLSWKRIGVIYQDDTQSQTTKGDKVPW